MAAWYSKSVSARLIFSAVRPLPLPDKLAELSEDSEGVRAKLRGLTPEERREFLQELRRRSEAALRDFNVEWLEFARRPECAAQEKFVMFLQDIFVALDDG